MLKGFYVIISLILIGHLEYFMAKTKYGNGRRESYITHNIENYVKLHNSSARRML